MEQWFNSEVVQVYDCNPKEMHPPVVEVSSERSVQVPCITIPCDALLDLLDIQPQIEEVVSTSNDEDFPCISIPEREDAALLDLLDFQPQTEEVVSTCNDEDVPCISIPEGEDAILLDLLDVLPQMEEVVSTNSNQEDVPCISIPEGSDSYFLYLLENQEKMLEAEEERDSNLRPKSPENSSVHSPTVVPFVPQNIDSNMSPSSPSRVQPPSPMDITPEDSALQSSSPEKSEYVQVLSSVAITTPNLEEITSRSTTVNITVDSITTTSENLNISSISSTESTATSSNNLSSKNYETIPHNPDYRIDSPSSIRSNSPTSIDSNINLMCLDNYETVYINPETLKVLAQESSHLNTSPLSPVESVIELSSDDDEELDCIEPISSRDKTKSPEIMALDDNSIMSSESRTFSLSQEEPASPATSTSSSIICLDESTTESVDFPVVQSPDESITRPVSPENLNSNSVYSIEKSMSESHSPVNDMETSPIENFQDESMDCSSTIKGPMTEPASPVLMAYSPEVRSPEDFEPYSSDDSLENYPITFSPEEQLTETIHSILSSDIEIDKTVTEPINSETCSLHNSEESMTESVSSMNSMVTVLSLDETKAVSSEKFASSSCTKLRPQVSTSQAAANLTTTSLTNLHPGQLMEPASPTNSTTSTIVCPEDSMIEEVISETVTSPVSLEESLSEPVSPTNSTTSTIVCPEDSMIEEVISETVISSPFQEPLNEFIEPISPAKSTLPSCVDELTDETDNLKTTSSVPEELLSEPVNSNTVSVSQEEPLTEPISPAQSTSSSGSIPSVEPDSIMATSPAVSLEEPLTEPASPEESISSSYTVSSVQLINSETAISPSVNLKTQPSSSDIVNQEKTVNSVVYNAVSLEKSTMKSKAKNSPSVSEDSSYQVSLKAASILSNNKQMKSLKSSRHLSTDVSIMSSDDHFFAIKPCFVLLNNVGTAAFLKLDEEQTSSPAGSPATPTSPGASLPELANCGSATPPLSSDGLTTPPSPAVGLPEVILQPCCVLLDRAEVSKYFCSQSGAHKSPSSLNSKQAKKKKLKNTKTVFYCPECNKKFTDASSVKKHLPVHSDACPFQCSLCPNSYKYHSSLKEHELNAHPLSLTIQSFDFDKNVDDQNTDSKKYKCEKCSASFADKFFLHRHMSSLHNIVENIVHLSLNVNSDVDSELDLLESMVDSEPSDSEVPADDETVPNVRKYYCELCQSWCHNQGDLTSHLILYHMTNNNINKSKNIANCNELKRCRSIKKVDNNSKIQQIKKFNNENLNVKTKNSKFNNCELCDFTYKVPNELTRHMMRHFQIKPYTCNFCNLNFKTFSSTKRHQISVHGHEYNINCNELLKNELRNAILNYESYYCCNVCKICYELKSQLKHHTQSKHSKDIYFCDSCTYSCNHLADLEIHMCKHLTFKYQCQYCTLKFDVKQEFDAHEIKFHKIEMQIKENESNLCNVNDESLVNDLCVKNLTCESCSFTSTSKDELENHVETHLPVVICSRNEHEPQVNIANDEKTTPIQVDYVSNNFSAQNENTEIIETQILIDNTLTVPNLNSTAEVEKIPKTVNTKTKNYYYCNICKYKSIHLFQLKQHKVIHFGIRPYTCSICTLSFKFLKAAIYHQDVTHGIRSKIIINQVLKNEQAKSISRKKYWCNSCDMKYKFKAQLKNHIISKHSKKPDNQNHVSKIEANKSEFSKLKLQHALDQDEIQVKQLHEVNCKESVTVCVSNLSAKPVENDSFSYATDLKDLEQYDLEQYMVIHFPDTICNTNSIHQKNIQNYITLEGATVNNSNLEFMEQEKTQHNMINDQLQYNLSELLVQNEDSTQVVLKDVSTQQQHDLEMEIPLYENVTQNSTENTETELKIMYKDSEESNSNHTSIFNESTFTSTDSIKLIDFDRNSDNCGSLNQQNETENTETELKIIPNDSEDSNSNHTSIFNESTFTSTDNIELLDVDRNSDNCGSLNQQNETENTETELKIIPNDSEESNSNHTSIFNESTFISTDSIKLIDVNRNSDNCGSLNQQNETENIEVISNSTVKEANTSHIKCRLCKKIVDSKEQLNKHIKIKHKVIKCNFCSYTTTTRSDLLKHLGTHTKTEVSCKFCNKKCKSIGDLLVHQIAEKHTTQIGPIQPKTNNSDQNNCSEKELFTCYECQYCFSSKIELETHILTPDIHTSIEPIILKCKNCKYITHNPDRLKIHSILHSDDVDYSCDKCDAKFKLPQYLNFHNQLRHDTESEQIQTNENLERSTESEEIHTNDNLKCYHCDLKFTSEKDLQYHIFSFHNQKNSTLFCLFCKWKTSNKEYFSRHVKSHLNKNKNKKSSKLNTKFKLNQKLKQKSITCLSKNKCVTRNDVKCKECSFVAKLPHHLKKHMIQHIKTREFKCPQCPIYFKTIGYLNRHIKTRCTGKETDNSKGKPKQIKSQHVENIITSNKTLGYACEICKKCFTRKNNMTFHMQRHFETKCTGKETDNSKGRSEQIKNQDSKNILTSNKTQRLTCDICKTKFSQKSSLNSHMDNIHTSNKQNIKCKLCPFTSKYSQAVNSHLFCHLTGQQFGCMYCSRAFKHPLVLKQHVKLFHRLKIPEKSQIIIDQQKLDVANLKYKCQYCTVISTNEKFLKQHIKSSHTNTGEIHCMKCNDKFKDLAQLELHQTKCHSENGKEKCKCGLTFGNLHGLKIHYRKVHGEVYTTNQISNNLNNKKTSLRLKLKQNIKPPNSNTNQITCMKCNKRFKDLAQLKLHQAKLHSIVLVDQQQKCICGLVFKNLRCLKIHFIQKHGKKYTKTNQISSNNFNKKGNKLECDLCYKIFYTKFAIENHMENRHNFRGNEEMSYKCTKRNSNIIKKYITQFRCNICDKCFNNSESFQVHQYASHGLKNVSVMSEKVQNKIEVPKSYKDPTKQIEPKQKICKPVIKMPVCQICQKQFSNHFNLKEHLYIEHHKTEEHHFCQACNFYTTVYASFKQHSSIHGVDHYSNNVKYNLILTKKFNQQIKLLNENKTVKNDDENMTSLACDLCNKRFINSRFMIEHLKIKHNINNDILHCHTCTYSTNLLRNLKRHMLSCYKKNKERNGDGLKELNLLQNSTNLQKKSNSNKEKACVNKKSNTINGNYKSQSIKNRKYLKENSNQQIKENFKCDFCSFTTPEKKIVDKHILQHKNLHFFTCKKCTMKFKTLKYLKEHLNNHHNFECHLCKKIFDAKFKIKLHIETVHKFSKQIFRCELCNYASSVKFNLVRHSRLHKNNHVCSVCGLKFKTLVALRGHQYLQHLKPVEVKLVNFIPAV